MVDDDLGFKLEDEGDDPNGIYPDDEKENADWIDKKKDRDIDQLDQQGTPFIKGNGWFIWFDYDTMDWEADTEDSPVKMLREEFPADEIDQDQTRMALYLQAIQFFKKWGIRAKVVR